MASLNDRDAGRDFEGNGPSSFDPRRVRVSPADIAPASPQVQAALDAAMAVCERAFGRTAPAAVQTRVAA